MKLATHQGLIEFDFSSDNGLKVLPRLSLDSPRITVSDTFETYNDVHSQHGICGALKFLDVNNEQDVLAFSQNNLELCFLELGIPPDVNLIENAYNLYKEPAITKKMRIKKDNSFLLEKASYSFYNKKEDILAIYYENDCNNYDSPLIEIARDFFVVHSNSQITGWVLKNCCNYICNSAGKVNTTQNKKSREIFAQLLSLFTDDTFERMNDQSVAVKSEIEGLIITARKNHFFAVSETLEEWIEDNY